MHSRAPALSATIRTSHTIPSRVTHLQSASPQASLRPPGGASGTPGQTAPCRMPRCALYSHSCSGGPSSWVGRKKEWRFFVPIRAQGSLGVLSRFQAVCGGRSAVGMSSRTGARFGTRSLPRRYRLPRPKSATARASHYVLLRFRAKSRAPMGCREEEDALRPPRAAGSHAGGHGW